MADYSLIPTSYPIVVRNADGKVISDVITDPDRIAYNEWLAAGNLPDTSPVTEQTAPPTAQVLYDHENRIRAQEGAPPLDLAAFRKARGL